MFRRASLVNIAADSIYSLRLPGPSISTPISVPDSTLKPLSIPVFLNQIARAHLHRQYIIDKAGPSSPAAFGEYKSKMNANITIVDFHEGKIGTDEYNQL